jgi:PAS domain-containing protein
VTAEVTAPEPSLEVQRLRERLADSEARLHTLIERNLDGIMIVDDDGVVRFANPAAAALFAKRPEELLGGMFGLPLVVEDRTEIDLLVSGAPSVVAEMRVAPISWEERPAYLASLRDVTDRLRAEELLLQKEEQLQAAQRLSAVGRFAAEVAREMNVVLHGVTGASRAALVQLAPSSPVRDRLEEILATAGEGAQLVQRLTLLAAQQAPELRPLDVNEVAAGVVPLVRRLAGHAFTVTFDPGRDLWPALADAVRVEQTLVTVAALARDLLPAGGSLHIHTRNAATDEAPGQAGEYVRIELVGAAPEDAPSPAGEALAPAVLSAARAVIEETGGRLKVRRLSDRRTSLLVYLPRAHAGET